MSGTADEVLGLLRAWDGEDPLVVRTSGSTGAAKDVVLSRAAMAASATATYARLGGPGQWLLNLPATYVAGLQVLFRSVLAGTEPVVQDGAFADAAARLTADCRYVSLVPTQLVRMLATPADREALAGFDAVLVGGARVDPDLRRQAGAAGVRVVASYGMSETCGGCVYDGVPLDGVAVALGADGRVRIAGPVLFERYDGQPELTDRVRRDGWFHTQDVGRLDEDGRLEVLGRVDDVLVSGGVNVPAPAVADRLRRHPGVHEAEVVGVPDPEWGDRVVAVVVGTLSLAEARDWVAEAHPRSWAPRDLVAVEAIPMLPHGKPDRVALRRLVAGRVTPAGSPHLPSGLSTPPERALHDG